MQTLHEIAGNYCDANRSLLTAPAIARIDRAVKKFNHWLKRPALLSDLTDANLVEFTQVQRFGRAVSSVGRDSGKILAIWRWAANQGLIKRPTINISRRGN